jgi:hypothetical protein
MVPSSYSALSQSRYSPHEPKSRTQLDANAHVVKGLHSLSEILNRRPSRIMRTSMRIAASGEPKYRSQLVNRPPPIRRRAGPEPPARRQHTDRVKLKGQHRQQQRHGQGG